MGYEGRKAQKKDRKKQLKMIPNEKIILLVIFSCMMAGILIGSIFAKYLESVKYIFLTSNMESFVRFFQSDEWIKMDIFKDCLFKYGKTIIILWLLAFVNVGALFSVFIIFAKGLSYGFTTAFIVTYYSYKGIFYATFLYLPQNLIFIPACLYVSYSSIHYIFASLSKTEKPYLQEKVFQNYLIVLLIGLASVVLASLLEAFLSPYFINVYMN